MPNDELFTYQPVKLRQLISEIISRPGKYTTCDKCGEEIINQREVRQDDLVLCKGCTAVAYYFACDHINASK
jgi:formylmethanofuran dehydrogenase subunit E